MHTASTVDRASKGVCANYDSYGIAVKKIYIFEADVGSYTYLRN